VEQLTLEARVGRLEDDPPIRVDSVDLDIRHPAELGRTFEEIFAYIATVEGTVTRNVVEINALLPDLDELDLRFLSAWSSHELAHAAIFDALQAELGIVPDGPSRDVPDGSGSPRPRATFRIVGILAANRWLQDVLKLVYLSLGAMHEHMTFDAYRHMAGQFAALGEDGLVATVTTPISRQEAAHLGYYRLAASTHRRRLSLTQIDLARWITARTYAPVGASPCGKLPAGRVFTGLAGDDVVEVLDAVQAIADQLLGNGTRPVPRFVHSAMDDCLPRPSPPRRRPTRSADRWP
jgi:hypothetical protein